MPARTAAEIAARTLDGFAATRDEVIRLAEAYQRQPQPQPVGDALSWPHASLVYTASDGQFAVRVDVDRDHPTAPTWPTRREREIARALLRHALVQLAPAWGTDLGGPSLLPHPTARTDGA